ncbi:class I SAM-dependent methyltransferase [Lutibacter sp. A80]|uniref:class I SAM-dependent methyltransferase n=1 Tax=Lutibacter sp. A80 TaxID=2918453 RepID=UPI001F068BB8|nr:class I SAM-dependent methyltransferase [Lutibacter sp. A80]UMB61225.1 class I SAM-dependent methyltransferase [Lutibacter sp. A80]
MDIALLKENIGGVDIYILDQILKENYQQGAVILDAGCGKGRNLKWFYNAGFKIYGSDNDSSSIQYCKELYSQQKDNFTVASVDEMPYKTAYFNHIICNAVLHFAEDLSHFLKMFQELLRILKPQGTLLIRMASNFGLENQVELISNGVYNLPDGSTRFLLTQTLLDDLFKNTNIKLIEDLKTTIVHQKRSMSTLVIQKQ